MERSIASQFHHFPTQQASQHHMHSIRKTTPRDLSVWSIQLCPYQEVATGYLGHLSNSAEYMVKASQSLSNLRFLLLEWISIMTFIYELKMGKKSLVESQTLYMWLQTTHYKSIHDTMLVIQEITLL